MFSRKEIEEAIVEHNAKDIASVTAILITLLVVIPFVVLTRCGQNIEEACISSILPTMILIMTIIMLFGKGRIKQVRELIKKPKKLILEPFFTLILVVYANSISTIAWPVLFFYLLFITVKLGMIGFFWLNSKKKEFKLIEKNVIFLSTVESLAMLSVLLDLFFIGQIFFYLGELAVQTYL